LQAEHIEHLVRASKDLFGAIFFVSVGMLIDQLCCIWHAIPVLILTFITIFGRSIGSTIGALISGPKTVVQTGMSLSQIGEFFFYYSSWNVNERDYLVILYPIVILRYLPLLLYDLLWVKMAVPFSELLERKLPKNG
jgi:CPA2 family monovalent cation:H+ antiporter-2